jgi:hypothetical protein
VPSRFRLWISVVILTWEVRTANAGVLTRRNQFPCKIILHTYVSYHLRDFPWKEKKRTIDLTMHVERITPSPDKKVASTPQHHVMKVYVRCKAPRHVDFKIRLRWMLYVSPGRFAPGIHWAGGWVGTRAGLDATVGTQFHRLCRSASSCYSAISF